MDAKRRTGMAGTIGAAAVAGVILCTGGALAPDSAWASTGVAQTPHLMELRPDGGAAGRSAFDSTRPESIPLADLTQPTSIPLADLEAGADTSPPSVDRGVVSTLVAFAAALLAGALGLAKRRRTELTRSW